MLPGDCRHPDMYDDWLCKVCTPAQQCLLSRCHHKFLRQEDGLPLLDPYPDLHLWNYSDHSHCYWQ